MMAVDAPQRFAALDEDERVGPEEYNYEHFLGKHFLRDAQGTLASRGIHPGEPAPDFELPRADGGSVRLSALRGRPVLLHLGSFS